MTRTRKRWSHEDGVELLAMKAARKTGSEIAAHFGTTALACEKKALKLRQAAEAAESNPGQCVGVRWTPEENSELLRRGENNERFEDIGRDLKRTRWACKVRYHALKRAAALPPGEVAQPVKRRTAAEVAAAAKVARESQIFHQSLTAAFCGDPLPGRSALDRRLRGEIEPPPWPDHRNVQRTAPVTLATEPMR